MQTYAARKHALLLFDAQTLGDKPGGSDVMEGDIAVLGALLGLLLGDLSPDFRLRGTCI